MKYLTYIFPDTEEGLWLEFIRAVNTAAGEAGEEGIFGESTRNIGVTWLGTREPDPEGELEPGEVGREEYPEARLSILRDEVETTVAISALTERAVGLFKTAKAAA